ncbi:B12-binding domain-containing radical SAM protein [Patescibacteria group bacterium]|nr:B12-binding domain-containing radical SAM protein [Patescibacteria group bacterium]
MSRQDPKVLLIYPPNQLMDIEIPRPGGTLSLLYLAGALRDADIEVNLLDATVGSESDSLQDTFFRRVMQPNGLTRIGMSAGQLRAYFEKGKYDIIGISSIFTSQTRMALQVARIAKQVNPETLVISGGGNAQALSSRFLVSGDVDLVSTSESDNLIVHIVRAWQKGSSFDNLDAVAFLKDGQVVTKPVRPETICRNLDELPIPAWDMLPFGKYDNIGFSTRSNTPGVEPSRYAPIMTSRGCQFRCLYCHNSEEKNPTSERGNIGHLRLKSIERVMQEVEILRSLGVRHLYFEDDSLLAKKERTTNIFRQVTEMDMQISNINGVNLAHFAIPGPEDKLVPDQEYLEIMKQAGFGEFVFPVESASQRILDKYASGKLDLSRFDVVELMRVATQEKGMKCLVNIMIGFPDETEEEMLQGVELAKQLIDAGATYVTFFIVTPFPGSKLFTQAIEGGYLSEDFDPDRMNWKNPVMRNTVVPPKRIVELRDWAWEHVNTPEYVQSRRSHQIGG